MTMSFNDRETSDFFGAPIDYFRFSTGSTVIRVTSNDLEDTINDGDPGQLYTPIRISRSRMDFSREDIAQQLTIKCARRSPVGDLFFAFQPAAPVGLKIFSRHRTDPEVILAFVGSVLSPSYQGADCELICAPVTHQLKVLFPRLVYQRQCPLALYGLRCGVDKADFATPATLTAVTSPTQIEADEFATQPDGWFDGGWVENADGFRGYIVEHVGNAIRFMSRFPRALAIGQDVTAYAGCDRTLDTCRDKFDNLLNHAGCPFIPGRNPHGGGAIG